MSRCAECPFFSSPAADSMVGVKPVPLNLFGIPFGLAGLGEAWSAMAAAGRVPAVVGTAVYVVAAASWLAVAVAYARYVAAARRQWWHRLAGNLTDPVASPFASLAVIVPLLLAGQALYPHAHAAGRVATDVLIVGTVVLGAWFTGQWIYRPVGLDTFHPGYFLPTVAGGLIASAAAASVGQQRLAEALFGLGMVCWLVLGSIILGRLIFRPLLPAALLPTLAIEVAPAAVASLAWFAMHGVRVDAVAAALAGYGTLMALAQLRMLPAFVALSFRPSTWAFTFSWAAVATVAILWLQQLQPAGYPAWQYLVATAISLLIGGIATRTLVALARRQLLAVPAPAVAPAPA